MEGETVLKIAVTDGDGKLHLLDLSESVARGLREKLNSIFGPDKEVIKEWYPIPGYIPPQPPAPAPAPEPVYPIYPTWKDHTIICGNSKG